MHWHSTLKVAALLVLTKGSWSLNGVDCYENDFGIALDAKKRIPDICEKTFVKLYYTNDEFHAC